jgi:TIR domain
MKTQDDINMETKPDHSGTKESPAEENSTPAFRPFIFVSYAHEDSNWFEKGSLMPRLIQSLEHINAEVWYDKGRIGGADIWREEIEKAIDHAHIAILLVSQSFINSDFIMHVELPRLARKADEKRLVIFPILVGYCNWESIEAISRPQMLPGEPTPLVEYLEPLAKWERVQHEIFQALRRQIEKITTLMSKPGAQTPIPEHTPPAFKPDPPVPKLIPKQSPGGHSSEPYAPIVGLLIMDSKGVETTLTEFGIGFPKLETAVKGYFNIERGTGSMSIPWDSIESIGIHGRDDVHVLFRDGKSLDHVKPRLGTLVGIDASGFTAVFEFANLRSVTPLRDTSVPELEAIIRDIPILAKRTLPNSSYTCALTLEPDREGVTVTVEIFFQSKIAATGTQTFRMPGPHKFSAGDDSVSISIGTDGSVNLGRFDRGTAHALAHALNRLNELLAEERAAKT